MISLPIVLFTFTIIAFFLIRRRAKLLTKRSDGFIDSEFGIPMTKQEVELERQANEEIMKLLEASIIASGFFKAEKISELIANLKEGYIPFGRLNTEAFDNDVFLTVEEKKY